MAIQLLYNVFILFFKYSNPGASSTTKGDLIMMFEFKFGGKKSTGLTHITS